MPYLKNKLYVKIIWRLKNETITKYDLALQKRERIILTKCIPGCTLRKCRIERKDFEKE
jgi:hypothetical protein